MKRSDEQGFTLVELMVAIFLFSVLSIGFYQVMFSSVRGSNTAADVAESSEEARLGFNRMIRDTREATKLVSADEDSYRIWSDFNRNEIVDEDDYEYLEYAYDGNTLTLTALSGPPAGDPELITGGEATLPGTETETLAANIRQLEDDVPVFTYVSNFLEFDTNDDGETDQEEIELGVTGISNDNLDDTELLYVSDVNYAFCIPTGEAPAGTCAELDDEGQRTFYGQAQIRNRRYSNL